MFDHKDFHKTPIIGILRKINSSALPYILDTYVNAGLTTIEITMNSPEATDQIRYAVKHFGDQLYIGAGTVRNKDELKSALQAGAGYIVTPNSNETVINYCKELQIPIFPGALTPTEIYRAYSLGANMVKVFPASAMGPGYFKSILSPLDNIPLIATGGITKENMTEYLKAGATGLGIGSTLFDKEMILRKNWTGLQNHMHDFVVNVNVLKKQTNPEIKE
ncbi:bifunctional 4-hydroxy-2-oxoglutarate aldolase/2-dehydro-3-deoxy-phosphogluconate aldolase [Membranihabitans maritimus]|uniref:bifunctional 4-hydroxy-2-oxoglutarate aldolase/2-dehydro-3-deoxy-phosphogluconate aldolase n=1 Tax=Membranihabitans maritimus TaxID=2904244 RepID=UPI001F16597D|nr:bifunctional 4-hydroxy-2-oxoglutarate aldolase/2-dehydro-3-deoxy-phosphogluconate aldolase [Membranihabitans maritimus]